MLLFCVVIVDDVQTKSTSRYQMINGKANLLQIHSCFGRYIPPHGFAVVVQGRGLLTRVLFFFCDQSLPNYLGVKHDPLHLSKAAGCLAAIHEHHYILEPYLFCGSGSIGFYRFPCLLTEPCHAMPCLVELTTVTCSYLLSYVQDVASLCVDTWQPHCFCVVPVLDNADDSRLSCPGSVSTLSLLQQVRDDEDTSSSIRGKAGRSRGCRDILTSSRAAIFKTG